MAFVSLGPSNSNGALAYAIVSSSATAITAIAGTASQFIRVYKLFLVATSTTSLTFYDGTTAGTQLSGAVPMAANGSITLDMDGNPWFPCSSGNAFTIGNSGNILVSGTLYYTLAQY